MPPARLLMFSLIGLFIVLGGSGTRLPDTPVLIDDFARYAAGSLPDEWQILDRRSLRPLRAGDMSENEYFRVIEIDGDHVLSVYTRGEAIQITRVNGTGWDWSLDDRPCLSWDWRALKLPEGAREDRINDTGAAVYVTFSISSLGIPRSIKYTYSSTLPVGTVVSFRGLKVLVVASGADEMDTWMRVERNAVEDYRRLWDRNPPDRPLAISLWSDSNSTGSEALAYFDDIQLLSSCKN